MKTKTDKSLLEVGEMKERVYQDFINSDSLNFNEFMQKDVQDIMKKYNIKYFSEKNNEAEHLTAA